MINNLLELYSSYAEEVSRGGDIPPPSIEAQLALKEIPDEDLLMLDKSTLTFKELNELKNKPEVIPQRINEFNIDELDYKLLAIAYFCVVFGKGKFLNKLDLILKLVAKPYDVQKQINLTEAAK